ncbi:TPA: hypothetical protein ROX98_004557 [Bacillus pseudomycoides]|nr:hypothetical protein [Bacillus pseudomycoides]
MRKLCKDIQIIIRLIVILAIVTLIAVLSNTIGNITMLTEMVQETAKLGVSINIGLIAISIACMSFQNYEIRKRNKNLYLNYLSLMLVMLLFLLTIFLFPYLPTKSSITIYYIAFIIYFVFGITLLVLSLKGTYEVIKKTFE